MLGVGYVVRVLASSHCARFLVLVEGEEVNDRYELTTLQDVYDKIPADRIEFCLQEIGEALARSKMIVEGMKALMGDAWRDEIMSMRWPMTWIDDDGGNGEIELYDKATGVKFGSIGIDLKEQQE